MASMRLVFKNIDPTPAVSDVVKERLESVCAKFPDLQQHQVTLTLEMHNSPLQAGVDVFSARVLVRGRKYGTVRVEKWSPDLYQALSQLVDNLLHVLNSVGDRKRVVSRAAARRTRHLYDMEPRSLA